MTPEQFNEKYQEDLEDRYRSSTRASGYRQRLGRIQLLPSAPLRVTYMRALSEMRGKTSYPDANFTQRFTFGNIQGYSPREAIQYSPFTTLKGVLEKDTGIEPFNAPPKLRELQNAHDFGRYGVGEASLSTSWRRSTSSAATPAHPL